MTDAPQSPLNVVRAFLAEMAKGDYEAALKYVSDTCEYDNVPMSKVYGPAGIRSVLEPFFAPTLENEFLILREAVQGPVVMVERLDRHRLPDKWVELPVNGVWEVHDRRITLWRDYFDLATIMSAWPAVAA